MPAPGRGGRLRRAGYGVLVAAAVVLPTTGAARGAEVPAPAPTVAAGLPTATPGALAARYTGSRADIAAAERAAADHGDHERAAALHAMADPARQFLSFDGRSGGRSVEVFGELAGAERVAVLVPGADTSFEHGDRLRAGALALRQRLGPHAAVLAWLGYRTPATVSPEAVTSTRAEQAAPRLREFTAALHRALPGARLAVLCHSYGTVVCAHAAAGLPATDLVLYGSPGVGYPDAAALHTTATVWAGRAGGDWIADLPHLSLRLPFTTLGFGTDPVSPQFGAHPFPAGQGGHSDYLRPGSAALESLARIVEGRIVEGRTPMGEVNTRA
ncbi:alpha/beta hydrolase [Kitasatospora sp. MMS16-BH015]|uniref:alpha/beta hydrolase n=1 Tax=Kitasatospora sp. MMS16-BH015 TaxID=2018025 RepID=UPI00352E7734